MVSISAFREAQRAEGTAVVMAIGTANPPNVVNQSTYPDYYFQVTNSEHKKELKEKFRRICEKSMIKKRHLYVTEEVLKENRSLTTHSAPSLDARQDIMVREVPKLAKEAAANAIRDWGQPKSDITHLVFCSSNGGVDMPGADYQLVHLLGLSTAVQRVMLYHQGCFGGGSVLRIAKDLAENNKGARVLAVCSEINVSNFRGPDEAHLDNLVGQAMFGDGASAVIVGADPVLGVERPIFEIVDTKQVLLPQSEGSIEGHLRELGLTLHLVSQVPVIISKNIEKSLLEAFRPSGVDDWNSIFWIVHPGGRAILDQVEAQLKLEPEKFTATRKVLREYGNMSSACVFFVMDEMRRRSAEEGRRTTGEGREWGVLVGFGPGITMEAVVLRSVAF